MARGDVRTLTSRDILLMIEASLRTWKGDRLQVFPEMNFQYEEMADPHEYFAPYAWSLTLRETDRAFGWREDKIVLPVHGTTELVNQIPDEVIMGHAEHQTLPMLDEDHVQTDAEGSSAKSVNAV